jgi:hypothetical protein
VLARENGKKERNKSVSDREGRKRKDRQGKAEK